MLLFGASNGHSIRYNLVWLQNFYSQLSHGDVYPRWLMGMNRGAGSPVFYFYAPLPFYILSAPIYFLPEHALTIQLAWGEMLLIALSGLSFFFYASRRFDLPTALIGSMFYMLLPYHFEIDLWTRQDLGELANYIWIPLVLHHTDRAFERPHAPVGLAICYALLVYSHLPSALLFSVCLSAYVVIQLSKPGSRSGLLRFMSGISVGLLLSGLYWIPALLCQPYIQVGKLWRLGFDFHLWFFPMTEWVRQNLYEFGHRLFTVIGVTVAIFSLCLLKIRRRHEFGIRGSLAGCIALMVTATFLMSFCSTRVWEDLPILWKVQFPYRLGIVVDLAAAIAILHLLQKCRISRDWLSVGAISTIVLLFGWTLITADFESLLAPQMTVEYTSWLDGRVRDGVDAPEYATRWGPSDEVLSNIEVRDSPIVSYDTSKASVTVALWQARKIQLEVHAASGLRIGIHQFYFPNWHGGIVGGVVLPVQPSRTSGLMQIDLPAGTYRADLELVPLLPEVSGATVTTLGGLLLVCGSIWNFRLRRRSAFESPFVSSGPGENKLPSLEKVPGSLSNPSIDLHT